MNDPGPVSFITTPEPTNRPAPITPPIAIIVSCLWLSAFFNVGVALMASLRYSLQISSRFRMGLLSDSPVPQIALQTLLGRAAFICQFHSSAQGSGTARSPNRTVYLIGSPG